MSAAFWRPSEEAFLCELFPRYFPDIAVEAQPTGKGGKGKGARPAWADCTEAREARRWCSALRLGADAGPNADGTLTVDPQRALEAGRARVTLSKLQAFRNVVEDGCQSSAAFPVAPSTQPGSGTESASSALSSRLASQPDTLLAEVGLGFHLAAATAAAASAVPPQRPAAIPCRAWPQTALSAPSATPAPGASAVAKGGPRGTGSSSSSCTSIGKPAMIDVEVVAPELDRPVESIRSELINHYIGLRGSVVRAANVAPLVYELHFTCCRCNSDFTTPAREGRFEWPNSCPRKCKFARFNLNRDRCKAMDWQRIRLQEDFKELSNSSGPPRRMPRTVDCDLKRGLVGSCVPGDAVTLYGIIRAMPTSGQMAHGGEGKQGPNRALFVLYLEVKAVVNVRRIDAFTGGVGDSAEEFSPLQLSFIREIHQEHERFPLLVASFCPQIYGQMLAKAALLLALLGGLPVYSSGTDRRLRRRGDAHVLLLGDPGLGKSELLRALAQLSPRGVYVSGNSSSVAGLTASVVRDPSGEFALEAGALILADNGLCCIDEFDKMGADQQALLEAMEQQTVSIAKAGIVCTLPARTTVVTAANPSKGSWDMSLTFAQNLKGVMTEALLSRFDVVFLMRDEENSQEDAALARHIASRHAAAGSAKFLGGDSSDWANSADAEKDAAGGRQALVERCRKQVTTQDGGLPAELLMTYLRYAKRYCQPSLSNAARSRIKEFYLERRKSDHAAGGSMPITARQLEALIRLSEARARAELRRVVLRSDVEDVIEIMKAGLSDLQEVLPQVAQRKGKSRHNVIVERLRQVLERRARQGGGDRQFTERELRQIAGEGVPPQEFDKALQRLNAEGTLLLASSGNYKYHA